MLPEEAHQLTSGLTRKGKAGIWPGGRFLDASGCVTGCVWSRLMPRLLARGVGKCKAKGFRGRGEERNIVQVERNATLYPIVHVYWTKLVRDPFTFTFEFAMFAARRTPGTPQGARTGPVEAQTCPSKE